MAKVSSGFCLAMTLSKLILRPLSTDTYLFPTKARLVSRHWHLVLLACTLIHLNCQRSGDRTQKRSSLAADLKSYYPGQELDQVISVAELLDQFVLESHHSDNLSDAYLDLLSRPPQTFEVDSIDDRIGALISSIPLANRSLLWFCGLAFQPTGTNGLGPYILRPHLTIKEDGPLGRYFHAYLGDRDFTFTPYVLQNWAFEDPFAGSFGHIRHSIHELDFSQEQDRFFAAIAFCSYVYNGLISEQLYEAHYLQDVEAIIQRLHQRDVSQGREVRDYRAELEHMNRHRK